MCLKNFKNLQARCSVFVAAVLLGGSPMPGSAEKADRDKPINLEADKVSLDDNQKVSVFEGNVILTQGTTKITAAKR